MRQIHRSSILFPQCLFDSSSIYVRKANQIWPRKIGWGGGNKSQLVENPFCDLTPPLPTVGLVELIAFAFFEILFCLRPEKCMTFLKNIEEIILIIFTKFFFWRTFSLLETLLSLSPSAQYDPYLHFHQKRKCESFSFFSTNRVRFPGIGRGSGKQ